MRRWLLRRAYAAKELWSKAYGPRTIGVRALVVDGEGRVLLVRHTYGPPRWHMPGGGVHRREALVDALARELGEEVGLEPVAAPRQLGTYSNLRGGRSDHVTVFVVTAWRERAPTRSAEIAELGWFPVDDLPDGATPATVRRIADWRDGGPSDLRW